MRRQSWMTTYVPSLAMIQSKITLYFSSHSCALLTRMSGQIRQILDTTTVYHRPNATSSSRIDYHRQARRPIGWKNKQNRAKNLCESNLQFNGRFSDILFRTAVSQWLSCVLVRRVPSIDRVGFLVDV